MFIYNHEKDLVERALINLGTAGIELNEEGTKDGTRVIFKKIKFIYKIL